jgi:hypothetical protein
MRTRVADCRWKIRRWIGAVAIASLVNGLVTGCSTELRPDKDTPYRATGICRSRTTHLPLPGVEVFYLLSRADSLYPLYQDTSGTTGHYNILLSFTVSGALGFRKPGYRSSVLDVCEGCVRRSHSDDHELLLDVDLWPDSRSVGTAR